MDGWGEGHIVLQYLTPLPDSQLTTIAAMAMFVSGEGGGVGVEVRNVTLRTSSTPHPYNPSFQNYLEITAPYKVLYIICAYGT